MAKDSIKIDFSKEEEGGGGRVRWKAGDYHVKITKVKSGRSSDKDTPFVAVTFKVLDGPKKGKTIVEHLYLTPKSLKRMRMLLEAVGVKVPKKAVNIPYKKLLGKKLWIELEDDDSGVEKGYKVRSKVAFEGFMSEESYEPSDEDEDEDDEDDEDEDDDDEEEEDDDEDEDDEDDEEEDDEDDEDDDDEDDDEDDEEDDEEPVKKKSKSKKKAASKKKSSSKKGKKKSKRSSDDLEELDLEEL